MKLKHLTLATLILIFTLYCFTHHRVEALTPEDRAPLAVFTPLFAKVLGTDPLLPTYRKTTYSLTHVSIKVFDNLGKILSDYASTVPPERLDALLAPLGFQRAQGIRGGGSGVSLGQLKGANLALKGAEKVLLEAGRVMGEVEKALRVDLATDRLIEEEEKRNE